MFIQLINQLLGAVVDELLFVGIENVIVAILLGKTKRRNHHGVVEVAQLLFFQESAGDLADLFLIHGQKTLVKVGLGRENRFVAQGNLQKLELQNMPAHHHQAEGERGG